uniref:Uncharacterized protein LOC104266399 n=1 Tax=Phallusia mammillata TaxID=59560 RepID=A0A6F9DJR9_9ASCI|nr:uncharacterized protein LOC104266399 [Phallusia mammillata]
MVYLSRVSSSQLLGFILLLFAWAACISSIAISDWCRSVVRLQEVSVSYHKLNTYANPTLTNDNGTTSHYGIISEKNTSHHAANQTKLTRLIKRWHTLGHKGLWKECINLPVISVDRFKTMPVRYNTKNISVTYGITTPQNTGESEATTVGGLEESGRNVTKPPKKTVVITPDQFYDSREKIATTSNWKHIQDCTKIVMEKTSCLLLSIRTMLMLGLLSGGLCVVVTLMSIIADKRIRERSISHPMRHHFHSRNVLSVLASAMSMISGILVLVSCWWFTLDTNLLFLMPSYQEFHSKNGAFFIAGTGIYACITSGVTFVIVAALLGSTNIVQRPIDLLEMKEFK